jgi:hypothetical protein
LREADQEGDNPLRKLLDKSITRHNHVEAAFDKRIKNMALYKLPSRLSLENACPSNQTGAFADDNDPVTPDAASI